MLVSLKIQNVALIPEVEIEFGAGLNVLTGETGAGKSIIIGSFNFVLGERLNKNVIRAGANSARVDAVFNVLGAEARKVASASGIEIPDNTVILSRVLKTDGKSECRINGNVVTSEMLRLVAATLVHIHGQHETEVLLKPKNHVNILDTFGGQKIFTMRGEYQEELSRLQELQKKLKGFGGDEFERKRLIDMYQFQIKEIEDARLRDNEDTLLFEKKMKMQSFEKISAGLGGALSALSNIDTSFVGALCVVEKLQDTAKSIKIDIDDLTGDIQKYLDGLEFDEEEFARVDTRLDEIKVLKRKYGASIADIFTFLNETRRQLDFLTRSEEDMERIKREIEEQEQVVKSCGERLTETRTAVARDFEKRLVEHLCDLGIPSAQFECANIGVDSVEFLFSANTGERVRPLSHIISGGEMSRFMLALKTVTANLEGVGTLVFDEIDTGISGIMGHKIAEKMSAICKFHQVIAVTHLAQIAARSEHHFLISKAETGGKTVTGVQKLSESGHQFELKRMAGGEDFLSKLSE